MHFLRTALLVSILVPVSAFGAPKGVLTTSQRHAASAASGSGSSGSAPGTRIVSLPGSITTDGVEIIRTTRSAPAAGGPVTVTVHVRYTLITQPKAIVFIGCNVGSAGRFQLQRQKWVQAGQHETEFLLELAPGAVTPDRPLRVCALLSPNIYAAMGTSLAAHATNVTRPASPLFASLGR